MCDIKKVKSGNDHSIERGFQNKNLYDLTIRRT